MTCAPSRTRQHAMADNEGVTKAVASFYRDDSDTVSLGLPCDPCSNIIPVNFFLSEMREISPCHDRDFRKPPGDFEDFRRISDDFRTIPERC